jgi:3,4-dihydroxy 2-butanone 4-phosphate synthase/GTP cyclohydrolase II
MEHESTIQRVGECLLPTEFGEFRVVAYHDDIDNGVHLALVRGELTRERPALVRVHVQESLLDLFTDVHKHGPWTLHRALARVAQDGNGVVVILQGAETPQELARRIEHFQNQARGLESPPRRPARQEMRTYGLGSQILHDLGVSKMRVLGHAMKAPALSGFDLEIAEYIESDAPAPVHRLDNKDKKVLR